MSDDMVPLTSSTVAATVSAGCHVLRFSGFSEAKLFFETGRYVDSPRFEAAGHAWRVVVFFPSGSREAPFAPPCVSLGLVLDDESGEEDVHARVQFSLLRHGSKLLARGTTPCGGRVTLLPVTFRGRGAYHGFGNLGKELQQEPAAYVKDDAILIRCDVTVFNKPAPVEQRHALQAVMELFCDCDDQRRCTSLHVVDGSRDGAGSGKLRQSHLTTTPPAETKLTDVPPPPMPSASTVAIMSSAGCHVVKVSGYWRAKLVSKNGTPVESPEFKAAGHTWRIRCYPNGNCETTAGYMSLYLVLASEATEVRAGFHFSLLPHGKLTELPHGGATTSAVFKGKHRSSGFMAFMSNAEVEGTEYLEDDSLFIRCDIIVMNKLVLERHDIDKLHLLCDCDDDLCKNLHREAAAAAPSCKPSLHVLLKKMLLGCLPI